LVITHSNEADARRYEAYLQRVVYTDSYFGGVSDILSRYETLVGVKVLFAELRKPSYHAKGATIIDDQPERRREQLL
jgi:hypothetical protein